MKINVTCIYWFLYSTFVVSSCLLVILVSSEVVSTSVTSTATILQQEAPDIINSTEGRTNHNPENNDQYIIDQEPKVVSSFQEGHDGIESISNSGEGFAQFEASSQNSGVASEILDVGQEVVVTLIDSATTELKQRIEASHDTLFTPSQIVDQAQENNFSNASYEPEEKPTEAINLVTENRSETETEDEDEEVEDFASNVIAEEEPSNGTAEEKVQQPEDIPSFSEWAQKQLEEAEKRKDLLNTSTQNQQINTKINSYAKLRSKNYASPDCGAKIVAANPEAISAGSVLTSSRDEYKLNTCTSRIWFVVELCEAIQAKKIDLANFELFSSSPKEFSVSVSDRFPSREWSSVGHFTAKDERDVQSFELHPHLFGKYIKVELHSHHGSEHYCPISLFRAYGTSEFEVLEKEDQDQSHSNVADDDDDDETVGLDDDESPKNLFGSARDAVMSIVKKAAEVLGNSGNVSDQRQLTNITSTKVTPLINTCSTPSHLVVCDNCSDILYGYVYELLSCRGNYLQTLLDIDFVNRTLRYTDVCERYGLYFATTRHKTVVTSCTDRYVECVESFFDSKYIAALCNVLAVLENKVVLNVSDQYSNVTNLTQDTDNSLFNVSVSEPRRVVETELTPALDVTQNTVKTEEITTASVATEVKVDVSITSQINPTKTLSRQEDADQNNTDLSKTVLYRDVTSVTVKTDGQSPSEPSSTLETVAKNETLVNGTETTSETVDIGDIDTGDSLDEQLNKLMSELGSDITTPSITTTVIPPSSMPQAQKESIFVRLANRIKTLERNMSLSSQYLEELSRRYKKQVEELQRLLDKTLATLKDEHKKQEERDLRTQEQLNTLTASVNMLTSEKDSWSHTASKFGQFLLLQVTVVFLFVYCCWKNPDTKYSNAPPKVTLTRRQSIDVVRHLDGAKKRNNDGDDLRIVACDEIVKRMNGEDVHVDDIDGTLLMKTSRVEKKRKKKKTPLSLQRSLSITTLSEDANGKTLTNGKKYRRASSVAINVSKANQNHQEQLSRTSLTPELIVHNGVRDCPVALEESEHVSPEPLSYKRERSPNGTVKLSHQKHVRVSSNPVYMKTALSSRYNRSLSYNPTVSTVLPCNGNSSSSTNGNNDNDSVKSVACSSHRRSPTPSTSIDSSNSLDILSVNNKKEKKSGGFKKMFKKVFD